MATVRYFVSDVGLAVAFYTGSLDFELRQHSLVILTRALALHAWEEGGGAFTGFEKR